MHHSFILSSKNPPINQSISPSIRHSPSPHLPPIRLHSSSWPSLRSTQSRLHRFGFARIVHRSALFVVSPTIQSLTPSFFFNFKSGNLFSPRGPTAPPPADPLSPQLHQLPAEQDRGMAAVEMHNEEHTHAPTHIQCCCCCCCCVHSNLVQRRGNYLAPFYCVWGSK